MEMDRENRNYYNCRYFGHLTRNCRNQGTRDRIKKGRKLEYRRNENNEQDNNNLNEKRNLIVLN